MNHENVFRKTGTPPPLMKSSSTSLDDYDVPGITASTSSSSSSPGSTKEPKVGETWVPVDFGEAKGGKQEKEGNTKRRQKRLERNRESARESRRRRKQYLEVLEERVNDLSCEMDKNRREHVSKAVSTLAAKRMETPDVPPALSRTSQELSVVNTFNYQQLRGFATPPSTKFILWLTMQNENFYRGGRAASERLSAARIGERMLNSGTDFATPAQSMWPLVCNEINMSYEQEEKTRAFQRTILESHEAWVDRHAANAASEVMESAHDAIQAVSLRLGQRERGSMDILTPEQRAKLQAFASKNKDRLKQNVAAQVAQSTRFDGEYKVSADQHEAANLYILNSRIKSIFKSISHGAPLVTGKALKKLARRPCFESLGCRSGMEKDPVEKGLSRDCSFNSSGSLKRSVSEMSMDSGEEKDKVPPLTVEVAEAAALPFIEQALGHIKDIVPATPVVAVVPPMQWPAPTPVSAMQQQYQSNVAGQAEDGPEAKHQRRSSFLPAHLNVVPEEMWPTDQTTEDFLTSLADEDWAIGEGMEF